MEGFNKLETLRYDRQLGSTVEELNASMTRALIELPYLPSPYSVIKTALSIAEPREGELLVDLGCGDGRVLVVAASEYKLYAVGVELNPLLTRLALRECRLRGVAGRVEVIWGDLFSLDISRFDVVYCYPSPSVTRRLTLKLINECQNGCRVLIHDHPLVGVEPVEERLIYTRGPHVHRVYMYVAGISWP